MDWRSTRDGTVPSPVAESGRGALRAAGRVAPFPPMGGRETDDEHGPTPPLERLLVHAGERLLLVRLEEVDWIEAAGNYVELHHDGGTYRYRATLRGLGERLDPRRFARIHRSILVNVDRVAELRPGGSGGGEVILRDGATLALSRRYRRLFLALLEGEG